MFEDNEIDFHQSTYMGNTQTLPVDPVSRPFLIDRLVSDGITIGVNCDGSSIRYFHGNERIQSDVTEILVNPLRFCFRNKAVLEITGINEKGHHTYCFRHDRSGPEPEQGVFVLPYKTMGMGSKFDVISQYYR